MRDLRDFQKMQSSLVPIESIKSTNEISKNDLSFDLDDQELNDILGLGDTTDDTRRDFVLK